MERRVSLTKLPTIAGTLTAVVGLLVLIGWQFDIAILKSPLAGAVSMKANTAAAFLLAGLALILLQRSHTKTNLLVRVCALIIVVIGFISLCEYLFTWNAGIDELLFRESKDAVGTIHPGRMAPNTALIFLLLGFAFFVLTYQRIRSSFLIEFPLVFAISISVIGFVGYATGLVELAGPAAYTKMAIHTAAAFIVLCVGMLFTAYERQRSPITIEQKLFAGLTTATAVIIFISLLSLSGIKSLLQASKWVEHTHQVKNQLDLVLSHVLEVQSNGRGFILTGNDEYLIPREKASRELSTLINSLRFQIADNPRQQELFASLEKLVEERVAFSDRLVSTRKTEGEAEARLLFATNRGKMITDSIRVLLAQMMSEEDRLLQMRQKTVEDHMSQTQLIIYLSVVVQVLLLAFTFVVVNKDVIGRRKAEAKLRELNEELEDRVKERTASLAKSEEHYRSTLENLMEGCQIIDFDYRHLYINDIAAKQGCSTKDELLGHTMMERYPGIEKSPMFDKLRKCMVERVHQEMENEFTYPDGSKAWFDLHMEPVPEGVFILSIDITQRKLAEEKILKANRVYAVISQINQMIVRTRGKDELFREACRIAIDFGKFQMAWIGLVDERTKLVNPVVHSGVEDGYLSMIKKISIGDVPEEHGPTGTAIREGKHFVCDDIENDPRMATWKDEALKRGYRSSIALPIKLFGKVIGTFSLYARVSHFFDQEEIVLLDEVTNDISFALETIETEKRRIEGEEALRKSEERFRLISENVADLIAVLDLEGRRVYNSPMYKNIIGDPNELRGTDSFQEIHPYDRDKIKAIFQETVKTGIGQRAEYRFMKKDGTISHIESQGSVIRDKDGKITNVVVVSRDVTEKKLLDQQFMRMQRMESIGTLAGGIAHDLNNVLAPIMLSIEILKRAIPDERSQKMLETIETSAHRGAAIVKQILGFARGVQGEQVPIQFRHIINEITNIMRETFPKSISIKEDIPKDIWTIVGDPTNLHQLVLNLCVNARDAMPDGGTINIKAENKVIDEHYSRMHLEAKPGRFVMLNVEDTGCGIPPAVLEHIFEPFFTTKEVGKGTGLGLSTVHTIVKSHGGFANVYSEVGKGTTFRIYLPTAKETSDIKPKLEKPKEMLLGNGELILVVDDESSIQQITKHTLEAHGYRVITASDGTEAVALFASRKDEIALVLTDMIMPIMDGTLTIQVLRKMKPTVRIIASSGLASDRNSATGKELGANAFLVKPYSAEQLLETIHSVLHKQ